MKDTFHQQAALVPIFFRQYILILNRRGAKNYFCKKGLASKMFVKLTLKFHFFNKYTIIIFLSISISSATSVHRLHRLLRPCVRCFFPKFLFSRVSEMSVFSKIRFGTSCSSFFRTRPDSRKLVLTLFFAKKLRKKL